MSDIRRSLTAEHIKGLAPDQATLRTGVELARGDKWGAHGWSRGEGSPDSIRLWAEFPESRRADVRTTADLPAMRVTCSCTATRFPCRHVIALLLRHHDGRLDEAEPPDWLDTPQTEPDAAVDDLARRAALIAGMADLRVWLCDLARQGLAGLPKARRDYWLAAADRLVDAYAFDAAREFRDIAALPNSAGAEWPQRLLPRLGRLALLCEAYRRFDHLAPAEQGDVLTAAGQPPPATGPSVEDHWIVAGRRFEIDGKQRHERVWLYGLQSERWALLAETAAAGQQAGACLPSGATAAGELIYLPSAHPLRAAPATELRLVEPRDDFPAVATTGIAAALRGYSAALAANPWLREYPAALAGAFIEPPQTATGDGWRLRDRAGHTLPLPDRFSHGWHLLALAGGGPLALFGEWDGEIFTPLSVLEGDVWRAMAAWRGLA